MTFSSTGKLYFSEDRYIRYIDQTGRIHTLAGNGLPSTYNSSSPTFGNDVIEGVNVLGVPLNARFLTMRQDDVLFMLGPYVENIYSISDTFQFKNFDDGFEVTAIDGTRFFRFDQNGRHLSTHSNITHATLETFAYTSDGLLDSITDFTGRSLVLERDGAGVAQAIITADGQRTELNVNAAGELTTVTDAAGGISSMTYTQGTLLGPVNTIGKSRLYTVDENYSIAV